METNSGFDLVFKSHEMKLFFHDFAKKSLQYCNYSPIKINQFIIINKKIKKTLKKKGNEQESELLI